MAGTEVDQPVDENQNENQNQDPTKNIKAEFSRKFENIQKTNEELQKSNQELTQKLDTIMTHLSNSTQQQSTQESNNEDDDIDPYDPKFYEKLKKDIAKEATQTVTQYQQQQNDRAQALTQLINQYPELNDDNSDLTKTALEKLKTQDKATQQSAKGYKLAVYEAAQELGVMPVSKRKSNEDDEVEEVIGGGGHGMRPPKQSSSDRKKGKNKELDPKVEEIARQFGLDPTDKKVRERLIKRSQRTKWNTYQ